MDQAKRQKIRTCIGCGGQASKGGLKRIVRKADGSLVFDPTGRIAGRGAYVCSAECMKAAFKHNKLQRAFKTSVNQDELDQLARQLADAFSVEEVR